MPSAAFAWLTRGPSAGAVGHHKSSVLSAEADWTEGCHRKPEAAGAEMSQVRRAYARANLCVLPPAHTSCNHNRQPFRAAASPATCTMTSTVGVML
jgi:hypothetical protein